MVFIPINNQFTIVDMVNAIDYPIDRPDLELINLRGYRVDSPGHVLIHNPTPNLLKFCIMNYRKKVTRDANTLEVDHNDYYTGLVEYVNVKPGDQYRFGVYKPPVTRQVNDAYKGLIEETTSYYLTFCLYDTEPYDPNQPTRGLDCTLAIGVISLTFLTYLLTTLLGLL